MTLPFVDRDAELARLRRALTARTSSLVCVYGRRRVGKSRLVTTALEGLDAVVSTVSPLARQPATR